MRFFLIPISICLSALAQIALKMAGQAGFFEKRGLLWLVASLFSYGCSFATYALLLRWFPISRISPILTVGVMAVVVFAGVSLGEMLGARQWIGLFFSVVAIALLAG